MDARCSRAASCTSSLSCSRSAAAARTAAVAATLPTGFTEAQVAGGLASPTAMQFAPDGRLFVCEQGGRLRVIKDGALLATPFVTLTVNSSGERGLLGVAFDPAFALNHFVYLYYTATTPTVHNRISRFTANGDVAQPGSEVVILDLDNLSSATNHNGGALAFGPDGKLYAAVGENANSANAQTLANLLGKMLRLNTDGTIPQRQPVLRHRHRPQSRHLGARPAQPVHLRVQPERAGDVHQRRRAEHLGRDRRRSSRRELRLARDRGRDRRPALRVAALRLRPLRRRLRDHRRRLLFAAERPVPGRLRRRLLLRRLLRRLDSPARSQRRQHRHELRQRHRLAGRSEGDRRRPPVLPRARGWRDDRRRGSRRLRGRCAGHHDPASEPDRDGGRAGHLQRQRVGRDAPELPVAAQRRQHRGRHRAGLYDRRRRPGGQRRALQRGRHEQSRQRHQRGGGPDRHREPGADRDHRAAGRRHALQRRDGDHLLGDGLGSRAGIAARERLHVAGRLPPRHAHASVHRTDVGSHERIVHDPDDRRDVRQRVVPHLPDRPGQRRPHPHHAARRAAAEGPAHARDESRGAAASGSTGSRSPRPRPSRPSSASSGPSARRRRRPRAAPPTTSSRGPTAAPRPTTSRRRPPTRPTPRPTASRRAERAPASRRRTTTTPTSPARPWSAPIRR